MPLLRRSASISIIVMAVLASVAVLKVLGSVMTPLVFAFFLTILLHPSVEGITDRSQKLLFRPGRTRVGARGGELNRNILAFVSVVIVVLLFAAIFLSLYYLARGQIAMLASQGDNIAEQVSSTLSDLVSGLPFLGDSVDVLETQFESVLDSVWRAVPIAAGTVIQGALNFFWIMFLTLFLLLGRSKLRRRIEETVSEARFEKASALMTQVEDYTRRYVRTKAVASALTGLLIALVLLAFGLPASEASLWGFVAFVLNFIPIYGSIVAGAMVTLWTLGTIGSAGWLVLVGVVLVNVLVSNGIEPKLFQFRLCLGPVTILMSVILWGWIWGAAGVFLAVPLMVAVKLTVDSFDPGNVVSVLLEA
ncbi:AI-2E family transporter [Candidatus Fermentibacterales bacterium]|nr:AI-2E family transporter [Candidatus Fermentibacterales bacterium]